MKSKYDYDIIRDYLHGLVDQDTARSIRDLIRNDEVARNIAIGILQLDHEFNGNDSELEAYIEGLRQKQLNVIAESGKTTMMSHNWIKLAAAILVIAVSAPILWKIFHNDRGLLERELEQPYPLSMLDRGPSDDSQEQIAFDYYLKRDYTNAIASFDKIGTDVSDSVTVIFYNGLSHLYAGDYNRAAALLTSGSLDASRYREQASWYFSLALIKAGKKEEARTSLKKTADNQAHYKSSQARQLLEKLE